MRDVKEYTLYDAVTPVAITSSTDATPIVVTATSHGLVTGDTVVINGHATNIAANGIYKITKVSANTFSLQDVNTGADIAGSGAGAGGATGVLAKGPKVVFVQDHKNAILHVVTTGTSTLTLKVAGSLGKLSSDANTHGDTPNFAATQSDSNPYTYVQIVNLDTAATVNGATGIVATGADINNTYEINVNALKYLCIFPISWTQGAITAKLLLTEDN